MPPYLIFNILSASKDQWSSRLVNMCVVMIVAGSMCVPTLVEAQGSAKVQSIDASSSDTASTFHRLSPVVSALFTAPLPFDPSHAQIPEECYITIMRMVDSAALKIRFDTVVYDPKHLLAPVATAAAQRCLARFPIAMADTIDLPILLRVAIAARDTIAIQAVITRQLLAKTVQQQADVLFTAVQELLKAEPMQRGLALELVARMDQFGAQALVERYDAHDLFARFDEPVYNADTLAKDYQNLLALLQQIPPASFSAARRQVLPNTFEWIKAKIHWFQFLRSGDEQEFLQYVSRYQGPNVWKSMIGRPAPRIEGDFWFDHGHRVDTPVVAPVPGKFNLVVFLSQEFAGVGIAHGYETLRRLHQRFPAIPITLVVQATGFFRTINFQDAAQEAEVLQHYLTDSLQLPGIVSVSHTIPIPGTEERNPSQNMINYKMGSVQPPVAWLVDRQGRVVYKGLLSASVIPEEDSKLKYIIGYLLQHPDRIQVPPVDRHAGTN